MLAYWIMLIWTLVVGFLVIQNRSKPMIDQNGSIDYICKKSSIWLIFSVPLFFCALRSGFIDTWGYINEFKTMPPLNRYVETYTRYKSCQLFYGLESIFKYHIVDNYHWWLAVIAIIQAALIIKVIHKYSSNVAISLYIFVASGMIFSWMFNGLKQFLVATILFACVDLILDKKWVRFTVILLFFTGLGQIFGHLNLSTPPWWLCGLHQSAIIMLPIAICCSGKMMNIKVWILLVFLSVLLLTGRLDTFLETSTEHTAYANDLQYLSRENGMNIWRFFVSLVPPAMVLFKRKQIVEEGTAPVIDLSINMSFVTAVIYLISTVTSGVFIGRLPIYSELYSLILYPWLFMHPYRKERKWLLPVMILFYLAFFIYQMYHAFGEPYYSDILTIFN